MAAFESVYLLHGKGGRPEGTVRLLEEALLLRVHGGVRFSRPSQPHGNPALLADLSVEFLADLRIPPASLIVGVSLGGLVAAKLQEAHRPDLHVIAISSPIWADGVVLEKHTSNRAAIYSSTADPVIDGRTSAWPQLAAAFDVPTLNHSTDEHFSWLAPAVAAYVNTGGFGTHLSQFRTLE